MRAFRVNACDAARGVTSRGQYRFSAVPPGAHQVDVFEEPHEGPTRTATVTAGNTARADIALKALLPAASEVELVGWDALFPPRPILQMMVVGCLGCHRPSAFHSRGGKTKEQSAEFVTRMWTVSGISAGVPTPMVSDHNVAQQQQKEQIVEGTVWFGYRTSLFTSMQNGNVVRASTRTAQQPV